MRVLLRAGFDRYTGYGNDAVDIARFLSRAGVDVVPLPTGIVPGLPMEFLKLLAKEPTGTYDVCLTFAPPFDIDPRDFRRYTDHSVGWSMWETSRLTPVDMKGLESWDGLDLMLVTCPMNVEAFSSFDPNCRYEVLACGIDGDEWPTVPRDAGRRMTFGMCGMLAGRKDPWLLINAWKELKADVPEFDARLELKTGAPGLHPKLQDIVPDLAILEGAWPRKKLLEWYHSIDVLVSTSRGEGNNKPCMEVMATGGPVIATNWSAHQNWLHPDVAYPLHGRLVPVGPDPAGPQHFEGDKDDLKELLLRTWTDRAEVREKGMNASRWIRQTHSWERIVERLEKLLVSL